MFFDSDTGKSLQPNLIPASDDALEEWIVAGMIKERLIVSARARYDSMARGEAGIIEKDGGRFATVACDRDVYHSVADRWPEAIDVALLARYAKAFADGFSSWHSKAHSAVYSCLWLPRSISRACQMRRTQFFGPPPTCSCHPTQKGRISAAGVIADGWHGGVEDVGARSHY